MTERAHATAMQIGQRVRHMPWRSLSLPTGVLCSGALMFASAPGVGQFPLLAFIAFAPWLWSLPQCPSRELSFAPLVALLSGIAMGLAYIIPGHWSTFAIAIAAGYHGPHQALLTLLFFSVYAVPFVLFALLDPCLRRFTGASLERLALIRAALLASLICGCYAPFPYTPVSAIIDVLSIVQWASVGGEALVLMFVLWPSALLAGIAHARPKLLRSAGAMLRLALGLSTIAVAGQLRIEQLDRNEVSGAGARLAAMPLQLDFPLAAAPQMLMRDRHGGGISALEITRTALKHAPHCEVVIWPETPIAAERSAPVCAAGPRIAGSLGKPLLMQCFRPATGQNDGQNDGQSDGQTAGQKLLTAEFLVPGEAAQFHGKSALVPMYEQPLFGASALAPGLPGSVFVLDRQRTLIPALCYELYSATHFQSAVRAGGNFIVHMANFSAFDRHPIDIWDQGLARLRAIEYGMPIIRASNRAPAGWIDAAGRVRSSTARFGQQAQCLEVWSPSQGLTPAARLGVLNPWLPTLLLAPMLFFLARQRAPSAGVTQH